MANKFTSVELCAGAGGQALGLHNAGFIHELLVEIDSPACRTLELNNSNHNLGWKKITEGCVVDFSEREASQYKGVDLVAGGLDEQG